MGWTIKGMNPTEVRDFLFTKTSTLALWPTQRPIQCVPGALSLVVKQLGHEANHSASSSAKVNNEWSYVVTPPVCLHSMYRDVT
jgi:hypothetical protein